MRVARSTEGRGSVRSRSISPARIGRTALAYLANRSDTGSERRRRVAGETWRRDGADRLERLKAVASPRATTSRLVTVCPPHPAITAAADTVVASADRQDWDSRAAHDRAHVVRSPCLGGGLRSAAGPASIGSRAGGGDRCRSVDLSGCGFVFLSGRPVLAGGPDSQKGAAHASSCCAFRSSLERPRRDSAVLRLICSVGGTPTVGSPAIRTSTRRGGSDSGSGLARCRVGATPSSSSSGSTTSSRRSTVRRRSAVGPCNLRRRSRV